MSTALDLITDALKSLGVVASGETLSSSEANDGLKALNRMLDRWSTRSLTVLGTIIEPVSLVVGQNTYTMGDGGDFDIEVPVKTTAVFIKDSSGNELPVEFTLDSERWGDLSVKTNTSEYPTLVYIDQNYPLRNVHVYPTPSAANTLIFHDNRQLSNLSLLTTSLSLPKGYEEAIIYNLAKRLAPEYGTSMSAELLDLANGAIADIKRNNIKAVQIGVDMAISKSKGWDYRTGGLV